MTLTAERPEVTVLEQDSCEARFKTTLRPVIAAKFREVAAAHDKTLAPLTDDVVLLESGLDSLCFAIIVATLEDEFGFDPFTEAEDVFFPVTFADFVMFYERSY